MLKRTCPGLSLFFLLFIACLVITPSCGPNKRTQTIQSTLIAVNVARDGFLAWDRSHQEDLVAKAKTREELDAAVLEYTGKRQKVVEGFAVAYRALAVAATQSDELSLRAALSSAGDLYDAIKVLMAGGV